MKTDERRRRRARTCSARAEDARSLSMGVNAVAFPLQPGILVALTGLIADAGIVDRVFGWASSPPAAFAGLLLAIVSITPLLWAIRGVIGYFRDRQNAHWKQSLCLLQRTLFADSPPDFAEKLAHLILERLNDKKSPDESLFRLTRLFVEQRILVKAMTEPTEPIPDKNLGARESYNALIENIDHVRNVGSGTPRSFRIESCFKVAELDSGVPTVSDYFKMLSEIESSYWPDPSQHRRLEDSDRFLTPIIVASGFIAPAFLITGLLSAFAESWPVVLRSFAEANMSDFRDETDHNLTVIQRFEFYCWLLWGPSIPVCRCSMWRRESGDDDLIIQYGYGDETNSIPLLLKWDDVDRLMMSQQLSSSAALAFPKEVSGTLIYSLYYHRAASGVPNVYAAKTSQARDDKLPGWALDRGPRRSLLKPLLLQTSLSGLTFYPERPSDASPYYSAYAWIMFEVYKPGDLPIYARRADRWRALFPIFEHSNIADGQTLKFLKRRLAEKACSAIIELQSEYPTRRFRYLCAFDDPGAHQGHRSRFLEPPATSNGAPDGSVRSLLKKAFDEMVDAGRIDSAIKAGVFKKVDDEASVITACDLPDIVESFYQSIDGGASEPKPDDALSRIELTTVT